MQHYSATSAIGPAMQRTRRFLVSETTFFRFLKIVFLAAIGEVNLLLVGAMLPFLACLFIIFYRIFSVVPSQPGQQPVPIGLLVTIFSIEFLVFIVLGTLFGILACKLRVAFVPMAATGSRFFNPQWAKYPDATKHYRRFCFLCAAITAAIGLLFMSPVFFISLSIPSNQLSGNNVFGYFAMATLFYLAIFLFVILIQCADGCIKDFLLPQAMLEGKTYRTALKDFYALFNLERGAYIFYVFMRMVLSYGLKMACILAVMIFWCIIMLLMAIFMAIFSREFQTLLHDNQIIRILFAIFATVGMLVVYSLYCLGILMVIGTVAVFRYFYAESFFGSRYTSLGNLIEPPAPPAQELPAPPPTPA